MIIQKRDKCRCQFSRWSAHFQMASEVMNYFFHDPDSEVSWHQKARCHWLHQNHVSSWYYTLSVKHQFSADNVPSFCTFLRPWVVVGTLFEPPCSCAVTILATVTAPARFGWKMEGRRSVPLGWRKSGQSLMLQVVVEPRLNGLDSWSNQPILSVSLWNGDCKLQSNW